MFSSGSSSRVSSSESAVHNNGMIVTKYAPISQFFAGGGGGGARGPDLGHLSFMYSFCPKSPLLGKVTLTVQVATLQVLAEIIGQIQYLIPRLSG